ncbi:CAP domain-containing protein [Rhodovulum adriaticum]|uniref:Cysteine-rich secretory family protein n=1 Tax=Rhodovulum adriaticum TaxID=35804 RepID=A0A4R2NYT5_RHOAD|nr:CAP domain-containing protein [Rhodovulum adriaticum]TCP27302.1 cysteine-rich secretory family protein [Rhodovulum adriaticum]
MPLLLEPDAREQLFLELINRARLDPAAEAARYGIGLNDPTPGKPDDTPASHSGEDLTPDAKQPLVYDAFLALAAERHSDDMLDRDYFAHNAPDPAPYGSSPGDRMDSAGYVFEGAWSWGENIAWIGTSGSLDADAATLSHHEGLFLSAGHRVNLLAAQFRETGIAQELGQFYAQSTDGQYYNFNASMLTQVFALSGTDLFLTGVAYDDTDGNDFYSLGEGAAGIGVSTSGAATDTLGAGGYALALSGASDAVTVTFDQGGASLSATVWMDGQNVKLDLVNGTRLLSSADMVLGTGATEAALLGVADLSLTGNDLDNLLIAGRGDNVIDGAGGDDIVVFSGNLADYDISVLSDVVTVTDLRTDTTNQGTNTLSNVSTLRFADGDHTPPGLGDPELEPGDGPIALTGHLGTLADDDVAGAQVAFTPAGSDWPTHGMMSGPDGLFALGLEVGDAGHLDASRPHNAATDPAITAADALDVLRMAVGLAPSFGPAESQNFVAADVTGDGRVTAADALDVLRYAVGLDTENAPHWAFFDAATDWGGLGLDAGNAAVETGIQIAALGADLDVSLTAILIGDMAAV